jgi:hypothetical protein
VNIDGKDMRAEGKLCRVVSLEGDGYKFLNDPVAMLAALRKQKAGFDLFTFIRPLTEADVRHPFAMEWDNMAALPISTFDNWWRQQIGFKARNKAKQATKKGVVIREAPFDDALVRGIWEIYNEVPVRQGRKFPHYGKSLEAVRIMSATFPESSVFIGAFEGDKLIGFIKLTMDDNRRQAGIMHILSMIQHRDKAPTNALVVQAVRSCAERGIKHLVYSNFAYGNKQQSTLSDFKERNGFQKVDIPRYYIPLTRWGALAFRLGLHRRFSERVPEPVAARFRELRSRWYEHKFQLKAESF